MTDSRTWTLARITNGTVTVMGGSPMRREHEIVEVIEAAPVLDLLERFVNEADAKWPRGQGKELPGSTMYVVISDARRLLKAHGRRGLGA